MANLQESMPAIKSDQLTLWRRMGTRFRTQGVPLPGFSTEVLLQIVPTTDADILLKTSQGATATKDISAGGGGAITYFTVPNGKRWTLRSLLRLATAAASRAFVNLAASGAMYIMVSGTAEAVASGLNIILNQGDTIGLTATGNIGDTAISAYIVYEEEDAF